jgi:hypothetical protein
MFEDTRTCPSCAQTTHATLICPYCACELETPAIDDVVRALSYTTAQVQLLAALQSYRNGGWQIVSQTTTEVQLRQPKWRRAVSRLLLCVPGVGGYFWRPLWLVALVGFSLIGLEYVTQPEVLMILYDEQFR